MLCLLQAGYSTDEDNFELVHGKCSVHETISLSITSELARFFDVHQPQGLPCEILHCNKSFAFISQGRPGLPICSSYGAKYLIINNYWMEF